MKKRITTVILLFALVIMLTGCGSFLPFLNLSRDEYTAEEFIDDFMAEESLLEELADVEDRLKEIDDEDDITSKILLEILTTPTIKSILLDNVRTMSYKITDVTEKNNKTTVTAVITHHDMTPILDDAGEILYNNLLNWDVSDEEFQQNEDKYADLLYKEIINSIKEAAKKTKPTETFTRIRFDCILDDEDYWEMEIPEEFYMKVLLMNLADAFNSTIQRITKR